MTDQPRGKLPELPEPIVLATVSREWNVPGTYEILEVPTHYTAAQMRAYAEQAIAAAEARAEGDARDAAKKVLQAIAAQFEAMAQAAAAEDECTRRDVWGEAAWQARKRTEHPDWIDTAIQAQEAERGDE